MKPKPPPKRHTHTKFGNLLRDARGSQRDEHTGRIPRVEDVAKNLGVTPSFIYQVEQGKRKPKDGKLGMWASVYGMRYVDLCRCLDRIPMDLIASLKEEPQPVPADPFSQLSQEEKAELLPFLNFVRWKLNHRSSASQERPHVV